MADPKQVFRASDTAPVTLYAKRNVNSDDAYPLIADAAGSLLAGGLGIPAYDYLSRTLTSSDTETYIFKSGGVSGTTVATIVIVYTDSTLKTLLNVTKT